jgi:hypothetical protein
MLGLAVHVGTWFALTRRVRKLKWAYALEGDIEKLELHAAWLLRAYREQSVISSFEDLSRKARYDAVQQWRTSRRHNEWLGDSRLREREKKDFRKTEPFIRPLSRGHLPRDPRSAPPAPRVALRDPWGASTAPSILSPVPWAGLRASWGARFDPWVALRDPRVAPQDPRVASQDPRVKLQDPWVKLQDPRVKPQDPRVKPQDLRVKPQDPWVKSQDPRVGSSHEPSQRCKDPRRRLRKTAECGVERFWVAATQVDPTPRPARSARSRG